MKGERYRTDRCKHMNKYVNVYKVDDLYYIHLVVGNQTFPIEGVHGKLKTANWHRDMLAIALDHLVKMERGDKDV